MAKIQIVACFAILLINMLACNANELAIASPSNARGKPKSGSIFGKRSDYGTDEEDLISTRDMSIPTTEEGSGTSRLVSTFCERAYRKTMLNGGTMPLAMWMYSMERLNAICDF